MGLNIIKVRARSRYEEEIALFLTSLGVYFNRNDTSITKPRQLDFFIPAHSLAIEFNGLYWHTETWDSKDRNYHASKTQLCRDNGVQLLTIFEDEWNNHKDTIMKHISHLCGKTIKTIGARKVKIKEISDRVIINNFLEKHHIQGKTESYSITYEGRVNNELVALFVMRKNGDSHECIRYCTDFDASYPGLFSKFISYIKNNNTNINKLTTVADLR